MRIWPAPEEAANLSSKPFNQTTQKPLDSSIPNGFTDNLLPLQEQKHSQSKSNVDAPRLPYPDVGGRFHEGWDERRGLGASQVAGSQHTQSGPTSTQSTVRSANSNNIFHADQTPEHSQRTSERDNNSERSHQSRPRPKEPFLEEPSPEYDALPTDGSFVLEEEGAPGPKQRPFSFMELSPGKDPKPVREVLQHVRSDKAAHRGNQYDRNPSPVSPQRSFHNHRDQYIQAAPAQDGTVDDFLPSEKQLELATQSPSYHFQDPNLHEHPAFRNESPSATNSPLRAHYRATETPRQAPAGQHSQFPPAVPPHGAFTTSWHDPSDSRFSPTLSAPVKTEGQAPTAISAHEDSRSMTPLTPAKKSKRASLFRSLNGRSGKGRDPGRDPREVAVTSLATGIESKPMSSQPENTKVGTSRSESNKSSNRLQRASTAAVKEQDTGKKKRFSALGVSQSAN